MTWRMPFATSACPPVIFASPGWHPPRRRHSSSSSGPAARWMAPSTPPPPSSDELAAFTIASTRSRVMSPWTTSIRSAFEVTPSLSHLAHDMPMPRTPIPTWTFAVVLVRRGDRFLMVHERKHDQLWYLPAGRVEPGERLDEAAVRGTLEETSIAVALDGVLRIEHTANPDGTARLRAIFTACPIDDRPPKSIPDDESLGAAWFTADELAKLPVRGPDVA